ncbi:hypothetical protein [Candidatus Kryptobacter tengchongensis]|uniref:Uncharacterized protein n=1 Tax=Kryptobacter tengchongensis TaxID=1643429 RepID=A0A916LK46_KRYT1|nr:hypothetical protein [Candidatus Kryptobacter tengchongensis]CUT03591.1 hypothetical protein JGI25_01257 [Candidatus Kryptobacter tengchongensis]
MSALYKLKLLLIPILISYVNSQSLIDNKISYVHKLRDFIRSENFKRLKEKFGDVHAIDIIYKKSLALCNYDIENALLVCGFATLDHRKIEFKLPIIGLKIPLILTSESKENFKKRIVNLPSKIFSDTLDDKDKLQHFFFSAYITYKNMGRKTADKIGLLIEEGEKIGLNLVRDERDIIANRLGQNFGLSLHKNPFTLPSRFFKKDSIEN